MTMPANRRGFFHLLLSLPVVGSAVGWLSPVRAAAPAARRDVYKELGIRPLINAAGTYTVLGGSLIRPEVVEAMASAAHHFVPLVELQETVGRKIAALVGCEAALVTAGAASALMLGTAACVAGKDADRIRRLPDTTGMKNEVIIQKAHRYGYDHAVRNVGVRLVEVETRAELLRAVNPRTAMMLFFNDANAAGRIDVKEFAGLGKKVKVPTLNDAAAEIPPVENLTRYLKMGYDLVAFSGGKGLCGPQSTGLLLGRKDLIEAAAAHNNPHTDAIGRTNKVGKEELVGMWAALKAYLEQDQAALWREWEKRVKAIAEQARAVKGVKAEPFVPPLANHTPHLRLTWDSAKVGVTPADVIKGLREGEPRIEVRPPIAGGVELSVWMLKPEEVAVVGRRLREVLRGK
jgi:L-seryl-tRNA(Ser) seleniumtransferase